MWLRFGQTVWYDGTFKGFSSPLAQNGVPNSHHFVRLRVPVQIGEVLETEFHLTEETRRNEPHAVFVCLRGETLVNLWRRGGWGVT